jgi:hypothetical protein
MRLIFSGQTLPCTDRPSWAIFFYTKVQQGASNFLDSEKEYAVK